MPRSPLPSLRLSHASALLAHVESALRGARVLLIGDSQTTLAVDALARGALEVRVLDPVSARADESSRRPVDARVEVLPLGERALRQGRYDAVVVENLGGIPRAQDLLALVPDLLAPGGVAVIATASEDEVTGFLGGSRGKIGYDTFQEWLEETFESSVLLAETPFVGCAIVDLTAEGVVAPSLDNGYLHGAADRVDHYVGLAGSREALAALRLASMSIVQFEAKLALASDVDPPKPPPTPEAPEKLRVLEARVAELTEALEREKHAARERAEEVARLRESDGATKRAGEELERAKRNLAEAERRIVDLERHADRFENEKLEIFSARKLVEDELVALRQRVPSLEKKVAEQEDELYDLDDALAETERKLAEAEAKATEAEAKAAAADARLADLAVKLAAAEELGGTSSGRTRELETTLREKERRLAELEAELAQRASTPADEEDVVRLEAALLERGRAVAELERNLEETAAFARTLQAELAQTKARAASDESSRLLRDLDELGRRLAEKEADLVAAEWTIGSLEKRLHAGSASRVGVS